MERRTARTLILGMAIGALATTMILAGVATVWTRRARAATGRVELIVRPAQGTPLNPREFVPVPPMDQPGTNPGQAPFPGMGGQQQCDKVLFFYQGRLYQLRPGPQTKSGGNPEFFYMQPYDGPQIPGFPQMGPGTLPDPSQLPVMKF